MGDSQVGNADTEQTRAETGIETSDTLLLKNLERSLDHRLLGVLGRLDSRTRRDTHERIGGRHGDHATDTAGASMDERVVRHGDVGGTEDGGVSGGGEVCRMKLAVEMDGDSSFRSD